MPIVQARDGTDLYVKQWGSGRPVVLIHGWPLSADSWDPQMLALANAGYRAIAYDRRGFGRSAQPWGGYDYDTLADDLADVMAATGAVSDATLIGFSMGGGEVARYLSRHDGRGVVGAALIGSVVPSVLQSPENPEGATEEQLRAIGQSIREDRYGFFHSFFKSFFGVGLVSRPVTQGTIDWAFQVQNMAGLKPILACAEAFSFTDFTLDLPAFRVPALIVHGTGDTTVPIDATARRAQAAIPSAWLIEYDGAPHGLWATDGDRFNRDLLAILGE